jgi:hypothetical protein
MEALITRSSLAGVLLLACLPAHALELRYGSGEFNMGAEAKPLVKMDTTLNVDTWTLAEPHKNIGDSRLYYQFKADYFDSDTVNKMTDFTSLPLRTPLPAFSSSVTELIASNTSLPVPADYRIHGVNLDAGVGYDLIKTPKGHVGVGVNTGVSTPFMKVRNMTPENINLVVDMLDTFDTKVTTYKAGVGVQGSYQLTPWLDVAGSASINQQTGKMDNGLVGSDINMKGSYQTYDVEAKIKPAVLLKQAKLKHAFISVGHSQSDWNYDSADVQTPVGNFKVPGMMDADFKHSTTYLGVGYDF